MIDYQLKHYIFVENIKVLLPGSYTYTLLPNQDHLSCSTHRNGGPKDRYVSIRNK